MNHKQIAWLPVLALVAGCSGGDAAAPSISAGDASSSVKSARKDAMQDSAGIACMIGSPLNDIGKSSTLSVDGVTYTTSHQPDASGPLELPISGAGTQSGACGGAGGYLYGSGIYETTGPIGGGPTGHSDLVGHEVPTQVPNGINMRLFARAFAIKSPCNGKQIMFVSTDQAFPSGLLRQEVLSMVAADPVLSRHYGSENIMLSATHTHAGLGGYGEPQAFPDLPNGTPQLLKDLYAKIPGTLSSTSFFDSDDFKAVSTGIVQAMRRAQANLMAHPDPSPIRMSIGELLNTNYTRSPLSYRQNSPAERARYMDANGHEVNVDKRFLQLSFVRNDGSPVGVLNWFGVHPTAMGNHNRLVSSDTKGFASLGFEKLMGTVYELDTGAQLGGADNFVAAFAQTDEGDTASELFAFDKGVNGSDAPGNGVPYRYRLGTNDPYEYGEPGFARGQRKAVEVYGTKQLTQALKQYARGGSLSGPIDYRFFYVDMSSVIVTDPVVLNGLPASDLPTSLYADNPKRTCTGGSGMAFLAGAPNGEGFLAAGYTCAATAPFPYFDDARNHYNGLFNGQGYLTIYDGNTPYSVPLNGVALSGTLAPLLCATTAISPGFSCQKEKPTVAQFPGQLTPLQIFRIGNLAILGVPWEVTTMAARRLRQTALSVLAPVGVDTVVIAGLSNAYLDYMATREEYSAQMYEGASTIYGPWQLAAAMQEMRKLAGTMVSGQPSPDGPTPTFTRGDAAPITTDQPAAFGKTLIDAESEYHQGDVVDVKWQAGYPGNDPKTMSAYLFVEKQNASGGWDSVATERDHEVVFVWNWSQSAALSFAHRIDSSTAEAIWEIPKNTAPGIYRIRHAGVYRLSVSANPTPYTGLTRPFKVTGSPAACR
ncbi:neutral/alkaline non-lysosomal ceramidase N-terminal domain-containing protein [Burkholderia pseudomultivorans]|uniref:Neutral ceramidase n=1 Tax=Burkholderia pseudomultivorans TaxID=1207504 RepID=A0A6P2MI93_9BURK|nr:neutral/alkaline non-lysosomal ceramidase N-terminal domain-containing protein [Burkholderia pseudomultivorans]MDR8730129.1 Neutral ceramidase [Burkholderia pseudomultivorans]MDR8734714.1 Neutral ceramidase [Burkholderia pseudomultivorans]MDR8740680.1 Neutral ceramidase [Burkholderia pseudomultivorans]MDR8751655.1 Neutral ceramidase [Burkholderia pseudomultivorans]MDR8777094.1 Neutral ceramidase [Burkholderia pseudomultivorans]